VLVEASPDCAEVFSGTDPFYPAVAGGATAVSTIGASSCGNGNPNLKPEDSTIYNVGFSWEAIDNLELSVDYQMIEYVDRIVAMTLADILNRDFSNFLRANNLTSYNRTTHEALRNAWFASGQDPAISRAAPVNGIANISQVQRTSENLSSNDVDVFDFRVKYSFDVGDLGSVSAQLSSTYYSKYEYTGYDGKTVDAVGKQNGETNLAAPLPQWKHALRTAWGLGNHSAALTAKYQDGVKFDTNSITAGWARPDRISSYHTFDVRYGYAFDDLFGAKVDFALGSSNVLNAKPDRLPILGGMETRLGDPFGRQYYAEVNVGFE